MKTFTRCALLLLVTEAAAWPHHSFSAEFDSNAVMTIKGAITKFEWMNPHTYFYLDAPDPVGKIVNWGIQSRNISILARQGWTKHTLEPGETVTVTFFHHKDPSKNIGFATLIVKADGTKFDVTPGQ
jgi:hypothetical protein